MKIVKKITFVIGYIVVLIIAVNLGGLIGKGLYILFERLELIEPLGEFFNKIIFV